MPIKAPRTSPKRCEICLLICECRNVIFDENRVEKDRKIQLQHGLNVGNLWI